MPPSRLEAMSSSDMTPTLAAASSIASGSPSRRPQIVATSGTHSNPASACAARWQNSSCACASVGTR